MKRKIIIFILILTVVIAQVLCTGRGRIFADYLFRFAKGEYDTNISVADVTDNNCGTVTAYFDGEFYYYDKEKAAICEYSTGNIVIPVNEKPKGMALSKQYIYYSTESAIYQYDYQGEEVSAFQLSGETWVEEMYLEGRNIYCKCSERSANGEWMNSVYILDSENISRMETERKLGEWEEVLSFDSNVIEGISELYVRRVGDDWLVAKENPDIIQIFSDIRALKICAEACEGDFELLSGNTGKAIFHVEQEIMAGINKSLYFSMLATTEAGRLTEQKQWIQYEECPDVNLRRSRMRIDENVWIILLEEYAGGSLGSCSEGPVGDYLNGHILYIDLESDQVTDSIPVKTGQVVYMDKNQYATMQNGKVSFYKVKDGKKMKEHKVKEYRMREDYFVEACYDKLFFYRNDEVIDIIDIVVR